MPRTSDVGEMVSRRELAIAALELRIRGYEEMLAKMPPSEARTGVVHLCRQLMQRKTRLRSEVCALKVQRLDATGVPLDPVDPRQLDVEVELARRSKKKTR